MKTPYDFYLLQGYPTPFYKENFAYEKEIPALGGGQKIDISRAKTSGPLLQAQSVQSDIYKVCSLIPFADMVYMMGDVTYNATKATYIDFRLIASPGRYYIPYICFSIYLYVKNIWRKRAKLIPLRLAICQSSDSLEIPVQRLQRDTVWIGYTMLHLVPIYAKFQNILYTLYEANTRLQKYFPQFSGHYQIASGCNCLTGSSSFKKKIENRGSGYLGSFINYICLGIYKLLAYIYRKDISQFYFTKSYRWFPTDLSSLLVKWKTIGKRKK